DEDRAEPRAGPPLLGDRRAQGGPAERAALDEDPSERLPAGRRPRGRAAGARRALLDADVQPVLLGERRDQVRRGQCSSRHEDLPQAPAARRLHRERLVELALVDEPALEEQLAEPVPGEVGLPRHDPYKGRHERAQALADPRSCRTSRAMPRALKPDVVCIGILVADVIARPVAQLPAAGTLAFVDSIELRGGGCALNTASRLANLGLRSAALGKVGSDTFGE